MNHILNIHLLPLKAEKNHINETHNNFNNSHAPNGSNLSKSGEILLF